LFLFQNNYIGKAYLTQNLYISTLKSGLGVTNNLDLETRNYMIQVLKSYPGAIVVISHDEDFLAQIGVGDFYDINTATT